MESFTKHGWKALIALAISTPTFDCCSASLPGPPPPRTLPECGSVFAPPFANPAGPVQPRVCPPLSARVYKPKFQTVGHDVLAEESEACFVPDSAFEFLDTLIERVRQTYALPTDVRTADWRIEATKFFETMGAVLVDAGFQLYIPTATLGDALVNRQLSGDGQHIADCDTGSLIYMSVAQTLGLPIYMVDIRLPSGLGHNYLRWANADGQSMDWDTNGRTQCVTPANLPNWQGRSMSATEVRGYTRGIRGLMYQKAGRDAQAVVDYRSAAKMYPQSPFALNNLAWLLATRADFASTAYASEAVENALRAVSIERDTNNLDTLACAYARKGDFVSAIAIAREVVAVDQTNEHFIQRLKSFAAKPPVNCVGQD